MKTITTIQGDTWDTIACRVYGNVLMAQNLMEARENIRLLDYQIFPAGMIVAAPEIAAPEAAGDLPAWRR